MNIHLILDLLSYGVGAFLTLKVFKKKNQFIECENVRYAYYTTIIVGVFLGALLIGSLNTYLSLPSSDAFILGKSILGAIVGGIIATEIFKKIMQIEGSTGSYFVPSLAIGIAIGRVGCFLSGLDDYTYGIPTDSFLGYDFGDGISRHPVQLYESLTMFLFFIYVVVIYRTNITYFEKHIFYQFTLLYGTQRFMWEFLKPYETLFWGLNIFQFFCLGLVLYALYHLRKC